MEFTDQRKWLLGSIFLSIASIIFVIAWTAPFWPPEFGLLSLPLVKTLFPIAFMLVFIALFLYGIILLSRTQPPPTTVNQIDK